MSANTNEININMNETTKSKSTTLPDKYARFLQFGYYFVQNMASFDSTIDTELFFERLHLFATVEQQMAFVQTFFDNNKDNKKLIRKMVLNKNKPKKQKPNDNDTAKPKRGRKKTTTVVLNTQDQLVAELVLLAKQPTPTLPLQTTTLPLQTTPAEIKIKKMRKPKMLNLPISENTDVYSLGEVPPPEIPPPEIPLAPVSEIPTVSEVPLAPVSEVLVKPKRVRKNKKQEVSDILVSVNELETAHAPVVETKDVVKKTVKPKKDSNKKAVKPKKDSALQNLSDVKSIPQPQPQPQPEPELAEETEETQPEAQEEDTEEELEVSPFEWNGKQYVKDDSHNVYDLLSQQCIGTFDSFHNTVLFI